QNAENDDNEGNEDNCIECTVQPLVELQEKDVPTGTSDETKLYELLSDSYYIFVQLYRWGKDVTNNPMWKARSKDSVIEFWQGKSGKIRMICRENLTEKLRLNQFVPIDIKLIEKGEISCQWGPSIDETIAQEEFNQGLSQWAIKFETLETCKKFQDVTM
ncbi:Ran-binding protein 1b (RanBP1b), partial [Reticulomyxa filosa]